MLLQISLEIKCDLLFTTRAIFSTDNCNTLRFIIDEQKKTGKNFFACVSVTRFSKKTMYLEPPPIPTPSERILMLRRLKEMGATTVLAMRPFLPVVDIDDYLEILNKSKDFVDIVLGECFYFSRGGIIQKRVFPAGIPKEFEVNITRNLKMDFDDNSADWDIWDSTEYRDKVKSECEKYGLVFGMHSDDAIREYLEKK